MMPKPWGSKTQAGQFAIYRFKVSHDQSESTTIVKVLDSTAIFCKHHATKTPIAWLRDDGSECGLYLCPNANLRPATKKEILAWQLNQL